MFEQIVDWFRLIAILQGFFTAFGLIVSYIAIVTLILAWMHAYGLYSNDSSYCLFKTKDRNGNLETYEGLWKPWIIFGIFFTLSVMTPIFFGCVPTKEYIVLKAVAPRVDAYVASHPDSLLKVENLTGIVDDTAKSVLSLVGTSADKVKILLEHKVDDAISGADTPTKTK